MSIDNATVRAVAEALLAASHANHLCASGRVVDACTGGLLVFKFFQPELALFGVFFLGLIMADSKWWFFLVSRLW